MRRGRPILVLACTISFMVNLEELLPNSILYSNNLKSNQQVKNCSLVAMTKHNISPICAFVMKPIIFSGNQNALRVLHCDQKVMRMSP